MAAARAGCCCPALICLLTAATSAATPRGSAGVLLQRDGVARPDSGLTWHNTLPTLSTFTLCVRLFSFRHRYADYLFSYATRNADNELALYLNYPQQRLRLMCCTSRVYLSHPVEARLLSWFPFCVAVDLPSLTASFAFPNSVDNVTLTDSLQDPSRPMEVRGGGTVLVGQDQDEPLGGTDKGQSFNGFIVDMFLTQSLLTVEQMSDYLACDMDALLPFPHVLDFQNITEQFTLGAETIVAEVGDVCRRGRDKMFAVFPEARTMAEATHHCLTLNGHVATPLNAEENLVLFNTGSYYTEKCTKFYREGSVWVGVFWNPEEGLWKNQITLEEATFRNFKVDIKPSSGETRCVSAGTFSESPGALPQGNWDIEGCDKKICTACQFERPLPLRMRGLCSESLFDRSYFIYDTSNARPVFNGVSWSRMEWRANTSWVLYQMDNPLVEARMLTSTERDYPVGVHDYEISGDKCPGKLQRLKLTSCPDNTFTCGDGVCIDMNSRCNLELDCDDHTDELNCDTLVIPPGYEKRLPPPKASSHTPAEVSVEWEILLVRQLDLLGSQLTLDVAVKRTWFDSRLRFKNLHFDNNLNQITDPMERIWYPDLTVVGSGNSHVTVTPFVTKAWGQRASSHLPDDDTLIDEDVFYPGISNPLVLHREITLVLMCTFDLTLYPFDTQRCPVSFYVGDYTSQYVSISLLNATFSGTRRLLEYRVTSLVWRSLLHENKSGQHIEIVMTNLYGYYISGAYVPTMLLVIISYLTFFFALSDFTNRVMVSLTSLLVMASLFSQIASGLPKTAYMKLIDVWFIFCILADFVIVFVLVLINCCMLGQESPHPPFLQRVVPLFSPSAASASSFKPHSRLAYKIHVQQDKGWWRSVVLDPRRCNTVAQLLLPVLLGLFVLVYFGSIAYHMEGVEEKFET